MMMMLCVTVDLVWFEAALFYGWERRRYPGSFGKTSEVIWSVSGAIWARSARGDGLFHMQGVSDQATPLWRCNFRVAQ